MFPSDPLILGAFLQILVQPATSDSDIGETCTKEHDKYRGKHGVPLFRRQDHALSLLAEECAMAWKREYMKQGKVDFTVCEGHDLNNTGLTPLIHKGHLDRHDLLEMRSIMRDWYANVKDYNFDDPSKSTGNFRVFARMVWKDFTKIGFGRDYHGPSRTNESLMVVMYQPMKNWTNPDGTDNWEEYKRNVFPEGEPCPCPEPTPEPTSTTELETSTTEVGMNTTLRPIVSTTPSKEECHCPKGRNKSCRLLDASLWIITSFLLRILLL